MDMQYSRIVNLPLIKMWSHLNVIVRLYPKHISYLFIAELEHEILSHFNGVDNHSSSLSNEAIKLEDYLPMETELTPWVKVL